MSCSAIEDKSQDEIDAVIRQLAGNDSSLAACSLVTERWRARCRQQSFRRARSADLDDLRSSDWCLGKPPAARRHYCDTHNGELWITPPTFLQNHTHFRPLGQITSLTLSHFPVTPFDPPTLKRKLCDLTTTVTSLRLLHPIACSRSLLCFLSAFKNIQDTEIHAPSWKDTEHDHSLAAPRQFHGSLNLSEFDDGSCPFLLLLGSQSVGYERIGLIECDFQSSHQLQLFISSARKSVRRLQIDVSKRADVPSISVTDCEVLEQVFISIGGPATSLHRVSSLVASITSSCFQTLILKLRATPRDSDAVRISLADGISQLDTPLSRLARSAAKTNHRVSLVLLGQEPEVLTQGLFDFQELGYIWAGEDIGGDKCLWTFTAPKNARTRRIRTSIFDWLRRRRIS